MQDSGINVLWEGRNALRILEGLAVTLGVSAVSVVLSLVLGVGVGLAMRSRLAPLRWLMRAYLEFVRIMPQIVLLFLAYFGLTRLTGLNLDGITASVLVFTLWGAAEMGDLVRGALISIPRHQYVTRMVKTTSLVVLIGVVEVLKVGQQIIDANRFEYPTAALWVYGVVFVAYFLVCWPISLLSRHLEKTWQN